MDADNFSSPQTHDGQKESLSRKVNAVEPEAQGRHNTMEHLALLRVDADSFSGSQHLCYSKKSFQSTLSKYTESAINYTCE